MKTLKIVLCLCALAIFSCETEDANLQEEELINVNLTAKTNTPPPDWEDWDSESFYFFLKRVVDKIASTISEDPTAAEEFKTIVQNNTSSRDYGAVVPLEDIFSDTSSHLYQAIQNTPAPCDDRPQGGWGSPHPPLGNHTATSYATFISHLLNDHCLELYLPFGFEPAISVSSELIEVLAVPHPLENNSSSNISINAEHFPQDICGDYIIINQRMTYDNLLIIRPNPGFSVNADSYCDYAIYNDIDFTEFFQ